MIAPLVLAISMTSCNQEAGPIKPVPLKPPVNAVSAYVDVTIDAKGRAAKEQIGTSSGNGALDRAAIREASKEAYKPKVVHCAPIDGGIYVLRVDFTPGA